ncbi:hypothetical protein SH601_15030 [Gracilibacillus sp. S3-1-1]|uniref:Uncharacterized protein n=1 Tax=Gracilibacillus pellucidus TaxID=3095368 RepID=A0ACC6M8V8_9BACI|nr:hypothetical protein [Gracilibacillus sp. S3-1-1]MDX8047282.1 hypothetical protein [Gracilibacillus sp. S3-1-1]
MKRLSGLFVLLLLIFGGSYFIMRLETSNAITNITLTLAMILIAPFLIHIFLIRPRSLPKLLFYLSFLISMGLAYIIIPSSQSGFLDEVLIWFLPIIEIGVILIVGYGITKSIINYRRINSNENYHFLEVVEIALKPKLGEGFMLHAVLTELRVIYYSLFVWFKRPQLNSGRGFSYHKDSQIKTIVILFSVLIIVEGILLHFLLDMWSSVAAWIFTILNIYALLYMVGLYNSVRFLPHVIERDSLTIRLGYQSSIQVDIDNVESIITAKQNDLFEKTTKNTYYSLLKIDSPQYEIVLKEPVHTKGSYGKTSLIHSVVFRADQPQEFLEEIKRRQKFDAKS